MTTDTTHPLAHLIPQDFFADDYIGREVGGVDDLDVLAAAHEMRHNVLLSGPTGSAKTSLVYAYAAKNKLPLVNVACNGGIDLRSLFGGFVPTDDGGFEFAPGELPLAVQHGAVILLNEVNFAPQKVMASLYGLLDRRRTLYLPDAVGTDFPSTIKAHKQCFILADFNPGYAGTKPLNAALKNRFAIKLHWDYDHTVEDQLLASASLLEMAEKLRDRQIEGDLRSEIPTNFVMEFEDLAFNEALGFDFACVNFVNGFAAPERPIVEEVLAVYADRIRAELGLSID